MNGHFIGKPVKVTTGGERNLPVSFILDGQDYSIIEITESWPDFGYGRKTSGKTRWWQKHNRLYYRVKTTTGDIYEIYSDRSVSKRSTEPRKWFASRKY